MGKRTGVIKYNINETGRTFTGTARRVDIDAMMRLVNGPAVQEAISKGDIVGYVGHQYREKFGLDTPETAIVDGKTVILEPTCKTIYMKCFPNGDLEHEQEFLDVAAGRVGQRLWESGAYGFSSVFHAPDEGGLRTPKNYFGMDLVRGPNFDANRGNTGAMLDSVSAGGNSGLCDFAADHAALLDSVDRHIQQVEATAASISEDYLAQCRQNDELVEQNARLLERLRKLGDRGVMLDSARTPDRMERGIPMDPGTAMLDSAARFMARESLPGYQPDPAVAEKEKGVANTVANGVKSAMSVISSVISGG